MTILRCAVNQSSTGIHDSLKFLNLILRSTVQYITVVKPACDERVKKPLGGLTRQILPNVPDIVQIIKRASTSLSHMSRHVQMRIEPGAQIVHCRRQAIPQLGRS